MKRLLLILITYSVFSEMKFSSEAQADSLANCENTICVAVDSYQNTSRSAPGPGQLPAPCRCSRGQSHIYIVNAKSLTSPSPSLLREEVGHPDFVVGDVKNFSLKLIRPPIS